MKFLLKYGYIRYKKVENNQTYAVTESGREALGLLLKFDEKTDNLD